MRTPAPPTTTPKTTGFSLSPGGLLLPYHVGALEALEYHNYLQPQTPIAGSSAGGIAVAAHACGVKGSEVLESTIGISDQCQALGGTRGRLLGALRSKLDDLITQQEFETLVSRPGPTVIAYQEVFPRYRSMHQWEFQDKEDLVTAICHSSSFPFFTTNWPVVVDRSPSRRRFPRLVVDGFFAVPRNRFGCPDFDRVVVNNEDYNNNNDSNGGTEEKQRQPKLVVDRTVMISVFPKDKIKLDACEAHDCISPEYRGGNQMQELLRLATQASSREELTAVYEAGWEDAERWCREHAVLGDRDEAEVLQAVPTSSPPLN